MSAKGFRTLAVEWDANQSASRYIVHCISCSRDSQKMCTVKTHAEFCDLNPDDVYWFQVNAIGMDKKEIAWTEKSDPMKPTKPVGWYIFRALELNNIC